MCYNSLSVVTQQYNIRSKTATFFEKSGGFYVTGASHRDSGLVQFPDEGIKRRRQGILMVRVVYRMIVCQRCDSG